MFLVTFAEVAAYALPLAVIKRRSDSGASPISPSMAPNCVIPEKAEIHVTHSTVHLTWIPAFAGMTMEYAARRPACLTR
jgi:hypothetical protein